MTETSWRIWCDEDLRVLSRKKRKRLTAASHRDGTAGQYPGDVWALYFQFDSTGHGKTITICTMIDQCTREDVAFAVDRKIDADSVIELLDLACGDHGRHPRVIRMENKPEFITHTLKKWAGKDETIRALIPPSQPRHNGHAKSFHNRMRDEL